MTSIEIFANYVKEARRIVVLTGAGMSTESGIPDFRSPGGLWSKYDPSEYATIDAFYENPRKIWAFFKELYRSLSDTRPNKGHHYLAQIEKWKQEQLPDSSFVVVTQNIDGFHQLAGSTDVIELHGDVRFVECLGCHQQFDSHDIFESLEDKDDVPRCENCSGLLKLAVVMFGEALPPLAYQRALQEAQQADLFIVLGSSLVVSPANWLVLKSQGKKVLVNLDQTPYDPEFDLIFHDRITETLEQVVLRLNQQS